VYVDHAGAILHSDSQLRGALDDLSANLYSNPDIQKLGNPKGDYGR
jgi:hypothetical protein